MGHYPDDFNPSSDTLHRLNVISLPNDVGHYRFLPFDSRIGPRAHARPHAL